MKDMELVKQEIVQVLDKVDTKQLDAFCKAILEAPRVFIAGEGRSGLSAKGFAMRLMHLGFTVYVVGETTTPALQAGDLFVGVSGSGTSTHLLIDLELAKQKGCKLAGVTSRENSPLGREAQTLLVIPGTVKGETGEGRNSVQLLSSLFDQCLHITMDVVCLMLSKQAGVDNGAAAARHF